MLLRASAALKALKSPLAGRLAPRARSATNGSNLSYSERMELTGRPISPHLYGDAAPMGDLASGQVGIYKFPLIAISSIFVRITGITLTLGTTGIALVALTGGADAPQQLASSLASSSAAPLAKFGVGFSLVYHYLGACRHIVWDKTAKGFTNAQMLQSSMALLGVATVTSLGLAMYSAPPTKDKKKKKA